MKKITNGGFAVAEAVKLCKPAVAALYPITPSTFVPEKLTEFVNNGELDTEIILTECEFSSLSACIGASATGTRAFTATASQGLALMHEVLFAAAGMRLPIVIIVGNRALSAPLNIWCFTKEANVLMSDLTYKPISKVKVGEYVLGKDKKSNLVFTKVKKVFDRTTDKLVKVKTNKGFELTCTPEHKFYHHPSNSHWVQAKSLKNKLLPYFGFGYKENKEFKRGWLAGVTDGDGCIYKDKRGNERFNFVLKLKEKDSELIDCFVKWSKEFGYNVRKTDYHKKRGYSTATITKNQETIQFQKILKKSKNKDFYRGYLSGMFDTDGSGPFKVKQAVIYNSDPKIVKRVSKYLDKLKIKHKIYPDKRQRRKGDRINYHIKINTVPEFFIKCRPNSIRKRKNLLQMTIRSIKSRLKIKDTIQINKTQKVYNLETETNNYIVNGLLVHNCDWSDSIAERDSGALQFYAENNQEAVDLTIQAFKIAENKNVLLPALVNFDGFWLTHTYEPVDMPESVKDYLPDYKPDHAYLDPKRPMTQGVWASPKYFQSFKRAQEDAIQGAKEIIKKENEEFGKQFGRKYGNGLVEITNPQDTMFVSMGSICGNIKELGYGLLRIRTYRPFPIEDIKKELSDKKTVIVYEKDISLGSGSGALFHEIMSALKGTDVKVVGFVGGLGGKDTTLEDIKLIKKETEEMKDGEVRWTK